MERAPTRTVLLRMATRLALTLGLALCATGARAAEFTLSPAESARLDRGETVIRASLDAAQRRGTVLAAMMIDAPPDVVFQAMTNCEDALAFVPHLRACRVLTQEAGAGIRLVEHEIDLGWFAPRISYVFSADVETDRRITFRQVRGDFKANQGVWEFEPAGTRTLLRYRVEIDPPGYVPNWLARATFRRELPRMLAQLKRHCESEQRQRTHANIFPY